MKAREINLLAGFNKRGIGVVVKGGVRTKSSYPPAGYAKPFPYQKSGVWEKLPGYAKEIIKILILRYC